MTKTHSRMMRVTSGTYNAEKADAVLTRSAAAEEADQRHKTSNDHEDHRQAVERHDWSHHRHSVEQLPVELGVAVGGVHQHADRHHR